MTLKEKQSKSNCNMRLFDLYKNIIYWYFKLIYSKPVCFAEASIPKGSVFSLQQFVYSRCVITPDPNPRLFCRWQSHLCYPLRPHRSIPLPTRTPIPVMTSVQMLDDLNLEKCPFGLHCLLRPFLPSNSQ